MCQKSAMNLPKNRTVLSALHKTIRYCFAVVSLPMRAVTASDREVQTCLTCHWLEYTPLIGLPLILYANTWFVNKLQCVFQLLWTSCCLELRSLCWSVYSVNWQSISVRYYWWPNSVLQFLAVILYTPSFLITRAIPLFCPKSIYLDWKLYTVFCLHCTDLVVCVLQNS